MYTFMNKTVCQFVLFIPFINKETKIIVHSQIRDTDINLSHFTPWCMISGHIEMTSCPYLRTVLLMYELKYLRIRLTELYH